LHVESLLISWAWNFYFPKLFVITFGLGYWQAQPVRHSLAELTPGIEFFLGWYIGICMGLNSMVSIELGSDQYLIQTSSEVI